MLAGSAPLKRLLAMSRLPSCAKLPKTAGNGPIRSVVIEIEGGEIGKAAERGRDCAPQLIVRQIERLHSAQIAKLRWNGAGELIGIKEIGSEPCQDCPTRRDRPGEHVAVQVELSEVAQVTQLGGMVPVSWLVER